MRGTKTTGTRNVGAMNRWDGSKAPGELVPRRRFEKESGGTAPNSGRKCDRSSPKCGEFVDCRSALGVRCAHGGSLRPAFRLAALEGTSVV